MQLRAQPSEGKPHTAHTSQGQPHRAVSLHRSQSEDKQTMADDADAARKERMADYRVGGRHLVHLGPDVLSRDAMQK